MWPFTNNKREKELIEREHAVIAKEEILENEKGLLDQRKSEFEKYKDTENAAIKDEFSRLNADRAVFETKRIEYEPKFQEAVKGFSARTKENEADIQKRNSEITVERLEEQKKFAEQLHAAHQKTEREHEETLLAQTTKRIQETDTELSSRRDAIAQKEAELRQREIALENDRDKLIQDRKDYEQKDSQLTAEKEVVFSKKESLDEQAKELADAQIKELNARLEKYKEHQERLSQERANLEIQLVAYEEIKNRLNGQDPEAILVKIQSLTGELAEVRKRLQNYPDNVEEELNRKQEEIDSLSEQLADSRYKLVALQKLANISEFNAIHNASLEAQKNVLEQDKLRLETLNAEQSETIRHFRELFDKEATLEEKLNSIMAPHENFTEDKIRKEPLILVTKKEVEDSVESVPETDSDINQNSDNAANTDNADNSAEQNSETPKSEKEAINDELLWLDQVCKKIADYGLAFSPRIIKAFHTALKTAEWSPLAVLAGVSGTGKSELPQLYAKFGGINFINIPVQPNWDSQEALLGYYNTISGKFEAQPLLKYLIQSQKEPAENYNVSLKNQLNIVLLDEMNLAHIEQYFAEFLSKLEERRGKDEGTPQYPTLAVKLGGTDSYPLSLGRNVLWVGTMNQDETTKSLSDKVLDRGIVINFPRPNEFKRRIKINKDIKTEERYLPIETWEGWKVNFTDEQIEASEKVIEPYKVLVEDINQEISNIGRAIGHRVWQSIENYIWNYPDVRQLLISKSADVKDGAFIAELNKKIDPAFEDQLVQKIMPKLRGIETRGESKKVLMKIASKITSFTAKGHTINISKDFENAIKFGDGQFLWVTSEYLTMEQNKQEER